MPDALRAAGVTVVLHRDLFKPGARDEDWLTEIGRRHDFIVLTKDAEIRRTPRERDALLKAEVKMFVFTSGHLGGPEMADIIVRQLPKIERLAKNTPGGFIARITRSEIGLLHHKGAGRGRSKKGSGP